MFSRLPFIIGSCKTIGTENIGPQLAIYMGPIKACLLGYSVLSDSLVKIELCVPLERGSNDLCTSKSFHLPISSQ